VAFGRGHDIVTVVTRLPVGLRRRGGWGDTELTLPAGEWRDVLSDQRVASTRLEEILRGSPVALLVREAS
jgi:(1->4)-alpha-D-glucan 1-alpha-D-glucosylmutase